MFGICFLTIPGPLSSTMTRNLSFSMSMISTCISGSMPASSHASMELSTASLTTVSNAFLLLSKPRRCLFLSKNSATLMSRCFFASSSAVVYCVIISALFNV